MPTQWHLALLAKGLALGTLFWANNAWGAGQPCGIQARTCDSDLARWVENLTWILSWDLAAWGAWWRPCKALRTLLCLLIGRFVSCPSHVREKNRHDKMLNFISQQGSANWKPQDTCTTYQPKRLKWKRDYHVLAKHYLAGCKVVQLFWKIVWLFLLKWVRVHIGTWSFHCRMSIHKKCVPVLPGDVETLWESQPGL